VPGRAPSSVPRPRIVVSVHAPSAARALAGALERAGFDAVVVHDNDAAGRALNAAVSDGLVCDARAPHLDGLVLTDLALRASPWACVLVRTTSGGRAVALEALRRGAYEFLPATDDPAPVLAALRQGLDRQRMARRIAEMEDQLDRRAGIESLVGHSRAIQRVRETVRRAAAVRAPVCLEGEPGPGKSMVARAIHLAGPRRERPFVRVRCGSLPPALLEVELFGSGDLPGALERADRGSLSLEGLEHLPHAVQVRLLWFFMNGHLERAGDATERRADVRVFASTATPLEELARAERLHPELVARLDVLRLVLPPLRERLEDLPELVAQFVRDANREHRRRVPGVTPGVLDRFAHHAWPGNVRELRDIVHTLVAGARGRRPVDVESLPEALRVPPAPNAALQVTVGMTLESVERRLIEATLAHTDGDKPRAAAMLGIGLRTLYRRLEAWGL
jgi:DNA-binding NtrC family response regulator